MLSMGRSTFAYFPPQLSIRQQYMSLDKTLLNLKILARVPAHGRICKGPNGMIAIEEQTFLSSLKRYIFSDGRRSTIDMIYSVLNHATEKSNDLINSKYLNLGEDNQPRYSEEYTEVYETMKLLEKELKAADAGLDNLQTTYHDDAMIISELEIIKTRMRLLVNRLNQFM